MKIASYQSNIRTIRKGDPLFLIKDKFIVAPRAGFEIDTQCPKEYMMIIQQCIEFGWIKPVAYMTAEEQLIETLKL